MVALSFKVTHYHKLLTVMNKVCGYTFGCNGSKVSVLWEMPEHVLARHMHALCICACTDGLFALLVLNLAPSEACGHSSNSTFDHTPSPMQVKSYTSLTLDNVDLDKVITAYESIFCYHVLRFQQDRLSLLDATRVYVCTSITII